MLVPGSIVFLSIVWMDLLMPSCLAKPAMVTALNSKNGKKLFRSMMDEAFHGQFPSLPNLSKEVSDLDSEFDIWKSALPSASAVGLLIVAVLCLRLQKKNNANFREISYTLIDFKKN